MSQAREAVLFDAVQTLMYVYPSVGHVYAEVAGAYGLTLSPETVDEAFGQAWVRFQRPMNPTADFTTSETREKMWWHDIVYDVFDSMDAITAFDGRFEQYFDELYAVFAQPHAWRLFEDVEPTIDTLARMGIRLGVVSNWDPRLHRLLADLHMADCFQAVVTSAEVGYRKPHPAIFQAALDQLGIPASRVLYVGDSYQEDVLGAQHAGIDGIVIDRRATDNVPNCLHTLKDLPGRIANPDP